MKAPKAFSCLSSGSKGTQKKKKSPETTPLPTREAPATSECEICSTECCTSQFAEMRCSHRLCIECHGRLVKTATTMSGVVHRSVRCPFCVDIDGIIVGDCPDGTMTTRVVTVPGWEINDGFGEVASSAILVTYWIPDSGFPEIYRHAYFPNTREGRRVVELMKVAFDRRLVFTKGTSMTTGMENVLVWSIHHKTALSGGIRCHGFPDETYLHRVMLELRYRGIY